MKVELSVLEIETLVNALVQLEEFWEKMIKKAPYKFKNIKCIERVEALRIKFAHLSRDLK